MQKFKFYRKTRIAFQNNRKNKILYFLKRFCKKKNDTKDFNISIKLSVLARGNAPVMPPAFLIVT